MKNVCYISNVDSRLYASNTNSKFRTFLDRELLHYISTQGNLAVALKSISFPSLKWSESADTAAKATETVIGLRSSITSESMICNSTCDKIISTFIVNDWNKDVCKIDIKNPVFYQSHFHLVANPEFELVEVVSNATLTGIDSNTSVPTIVEVIIKEESRTSRMFPPFNLLLVSSDDKSSKIYSDNDNMNFTIHLNERKELSSKWTLVLKSLQLTSKIYNIQSKDYWFEYFEFISQVDEDGGYFGLSEEPKMLKETIEFGYYPSRKSLMDQLNSQFRTAEIPVTFHMFLKNTKLIVDQSKTNKPNSNYFLKLSAQLAELLGFSRFTSEDFQVDLSQQTSIKSEHYMNLNHGLPKTLIVNCSIVSTMAVGKKLLQMLRLVNLSGEEQTKYELLDLSFRQNTYAEIDTKWFDSIKIYITDVYGNEIKAENNHPTIVQLMFVNL